jgi:Caspase domain
VNGVNYLIPVDAKLETQTALDFETVNAESIIRYMSSDTRVGLVFLDACRDNPLSRRFQKKSRSAAVGSGLATRTGSDPNLLIAFATAPGEVALDGNGRNSPFTSALIKYLPQSNKELRSVLTDVKADVQLSTKREQIPWSHDNLVTNLYLNGGGDAPVAAVQETTPPAVVKDPQQDEARLAWEAVKDTTSVAALDLVATRYDGTLYAVLAKTRAVELRDEAKRKAAKAAEQQATLNEPEEPSAPPKTRVKPQATRSSLSWGVILGSYPKANATKARARMRAARAEGLNAQLINTDNYGRLTPGLYAVVIGASSRSEALSLAQDAQSVFADAYAKQLQ